MRHLPNLICLLRMVLVWPIVVSIAHANYRQTLLLFFIAAVSDGLDGFLAKRFHWTSQLGKLLDPLADKLLLVGVFLVATWYGLIPRWLTIAAVGRDVLIVLGALAYHIGWGPLKGRPMFSSKINTLLQLLYVLAIVAHAGYGFPPQSVLDALAWLTFATVLISGVAYVREFTRRALQVARA
ncbi:MAG: CDP-alcohol phosphatidyltransferase family protein [Steroidobacteraceae bacterium]|jgi:cardiolipin synthase (CMP-forming)